MPTAYSDTGWFQSKPAVVNHSEDAEKVRSKSKVRRKRLKKEGVVMFVA